jgi:mannose-6-phosphate isomerase-like protein (cupin superfamily)
MSLLPGEDIGKEVHEKNDQFIRIEEGEGIAYIDGIETEIKDDWAVVIPAGSEHNITNTGDEVMKLYTVYGPAEHKEGTIHPTKQEAEENHEKDHFDGTLSE